MPLVYRSQEEYLSRKFAYEPGESIGFFGPNGSGKTQFAYGMANEALRQNPGLRFTAFMPKPADETTDRFAESMGLQVCAEYPFIRRMFSAKPRGHVFMPPHIKTDTDRDIEYVSKEMKRALNAEYWKGNVLSFVDDAFLIESKYKAAPELEQYLIAGRSNHAGSMFSLQQPKGSVRAGVSSFHYSQPRLLAFARENVQGNRERYGEIGMGLDPHMIEDVVAHLKTYKIGNANVSEFLVLDRSGPYATVVTPW